MFLCFLAEVWAPQSRDVTQEDDGMCDELRINLDDKNQGSLCVDDSWAERRVTRPADLYWRFLSAISVSLKICCGESRRSLSLSS